VTSNGHLACGAASIVVLSPVATATEMPLALRLTLAAVVMFGSLAPDLDMPQSYLGRKLFPLPYLFRMLISNPVTWLLCGLTTKPSRPLAVLWWPFSAMIAGRKRLRWLVKHRGFSHSLLNAIFVGVVVGVGLYVAGAALGDELLARGMSVYASRDLAAWAAFHGIALTYGCLVHLAGDACTISGVPLFLPMSERAVHILPPPLRIRTR
jgi:membrane-bound metal-dependent hydrolase YbcI (DUF457 family)